MPAGVPAQAFYEFLIDTAGEERAKAWFEWFTETLPAWGAEGWTRIDTARKVCRPQ